MLGRIGFMWGSLGVVGLLMASAVRLSNIALEFFLYPVNIWHWFALIIWVAFMAYTEGYKGFQQAFSPRVAARLIWLKQNPKAWLVVLAPLYAMGFIYASKKRIIISYSILIMVLVFITIAVNLPQPWRPIMDAGVVVGLLWGATVTGWYILVAMRTGASLVNPELPKSAHYH
ncbi:hypothetical protein ABXT60_06610 [Candidatus Njordibacter sp. Uisw_056]|jgi:hypothetical protein|uniref:hypothetical protein n=1 Tax=Candidatus Njordibacter sp. Uisw_056 TaxID=3230973 RepID=UPI003D4661D5|tara:strand:+ start:13147 stop:13665 length:519 start_codon:yes stop_codon:yes gene_type:complete